MNLVVRHAKDRAVSRWLIILAALVATTGCGPSQPEDASRATVSGIVTLKGQPLPAGTITFETSDPPKATSVSITEGGRYSTDRVPIGACKVSVSTSSIQFGNPSAYVAIPEKYGDTATSGLTVDVKAGENENVNFELKP
ncbi:MAG: hypothetical protein DCC67_20860 [Planctomycetota bacterium]|nr:MAG: hypothetical protein DCC67_20860 [Planctomycetota bacterium]